MNCYLLKPWANFFEPLPRSMRLKITHSCKFDSINDVSRFQHGCFGNLVNTVNAYLISGQSDWTLLKIHVSALLIVIIHASVIVFTDGKCINAVYDIIGRFKHWRCSSVFWNDLFMFKNGRKKIILHVIGSTASCHTLRHDIRRWYDQSGEDSELRCVKITRLYGTAETLRSTGLFPGSHLEKGCWTFRHQKINAPKILPTVTVGTVGLHLVTSSSAIALDLSSTFSARIQI